MFIRATDGAHVNVVTVHPTPRRNTSLSTAPKNRMRTGTTIFIIVRGVIAHHGQAKHFNLDTNGYHFAVPPGALRGQPRPCLQPERPACQQTCWRPRAARARYESFDYSTRRRCGAARYGPGRCRETMLRNTRGLTGACWSAAHDAQPAAGQR